MREDPGAAVPPWPASRPSAGGVTLRPFEDRDLDMVLDLSTDPYVPLIGTLPANCDTDGAVAYLERQRRRHAEGTGFSFAIADERTDTALGMIGLWLRDRALGRSQIGYAVAPAARGRSAGSDALRALTCFAWTIPELYRLELHIEPWNTASIAVATQAGFLHEGVLRGYLEIGGRRRDLASYALVRAARGDES